MRALRRALLCLVLLGCCFLVPAGPAGAAAGPSITWLYGSFDDRSVIEISTGSEAGVAAIEVRVLRAGQQVAVLDSFTLVSGTANEGVWHATDPLRLDPGPYDLAAEVTDAAGATAAGTGSVYLAVRTAFEEYGTDRASITTDDRTVVLSGRLVGSWPGGGPARPLPGFVVAASSATDPFQDAVTDADGRFRIPLHLTGPDSLFAYLPGGLPPGYDPAVSPTVEIGVDPVPSRLTLRLSPDRVDAGQAVTASGRLTVRTAKGWAPLPAADLVMMTCDQPDQCFPTEVRVATDAQGRYRVSFPANGTTTVAMVHGSEDPFLAVARGSSRLVVLQPARFSSFSAVRDGGAVTVQGGLEFGYLTPGVIPVDVQYSSTGHGGWRTLGTVEAQWNGTYAFLLSLPRGRAGFYRASYAGLKDTVRSAVSPVVRVR